MGQSPSSPSETDQASEVSAPGDNPFSRFGSGPVPIPEAFALVADLAPPDRSRALETLRRLDPNSHREVVSLLGHDDENTLIAFAPPAPKADINQATVSEQTSLETRPVGEPAESAPPSLISPTGLQAAELPGPSARQSDVTLVANDATRPESWVGSPRGLLQSAARIGLGTVKGRTLLACCLLAILCVLGGRVLESQVSESLKRQIGEQLAVLAERQAGGLRAWIRGRQQDVLLYGRSASVRAAIDELIEAAQTTPPKDLPGHPAQARLREALEEVTSVKTQEDGQADGLRYAIWQPNREQIGDWMLNPDDYGHVESATGSAPLARVFAGEVVTYIPNTGGAYTAGLEFRNPPEIAFTAPVYGTDPRTGAKRVVAALLIGGIFQPEFNELLSAGTFGVSGETYAVNIDGRLISKSRFDDTLEQLGWPQVGVDNTTVGISVTDPGRNLTTSPIEPAAARERNASQPPTAMVDRLIGADRTVQILTPYPDYRGVPVVGAGTWMSEIGMGLIAEMDASQAYESLDLVVRAVRLMNLGIGMALLTALMLGAYVWRLNKRVAQQKRLGPYILHDVIGEGGMGTVWRAEHDLLCRPTAVKVLKDGFDDDLSLARFQREVRLASILQSPHTIDIYDYGQTDRGQFYCAMALLEGLTLRQLVGECGRVPAARVVHILKQIARSLAEAHELGLVHRDIKPANIMLCDRGGEADWVIVLDFGLAKQIAPGAGPKVTHTTMLIGTPDFIAPERIRDPSTVDPRSDLYSVGILAYLLLTGRPCFESTGHLDALQQTLFADPTPPSEVAVGSAVPPDVDAIVLDLLRKDPGDRIGSAAELLDRLRQADVFEWTREDARKWWDERSRSPQ